MKGLMIAMAAGLCMLATTASADWHSGDYVLSKNGSETGTQTFNIKRSSETGRLFMASKTKGAFPGGEGELSGALEMEANGELKKYSTVRRRVKQKPLRGIFFVYKGKIRAIPIKGQSEPTDFERIPEDILVLDSRILGFWNMVAMRTVGKAGAIAVPYIDITSVGMKNLTVETKGTSGVDRRGKFIELSLLDVRGDSGRWTIAATREGKVYGGTNGVLTFGVKGIDLSAVFKKKAEPVEKAEEPDSAEETEPKEEVQKEE